MSLLSWKDCDDGSTALASRSIGGEYRIEVEWGYSEEGKYRYYKPLRIAPVGYPLTTLEGAKAICQAHYDQLQKRRADR